MYNFDGLLFTNEEFFGHLTSHISKGIFDKCIIVYDLVLLLLL